eukprot:5476046-Prymnesium_polylepis.1
MRSRAHRRLKLWHNELACGLMSKTIGASRRETLAVLKARIGRAINAPAETLRLRRAPRER